MPNSPKQANLTIHTDLLPRLRFMQGWRQMQEPHHVVTLSATIEWLLGLGEAQVHDFEGK